MEPNLSHHGNSKNKTIPPPLQSHLSKEEDTFAITSVYKYG